MPAIKARIRRELKDKRASLTARERGPLDRRICGHVLRHLEDGGFDAFGAYLSQSGEPDMEPLLQREHEAGRTIFLPVVHPEQKGEMDFVSWRPDAELINNRYGVREPEDGESARAGDMPMVLTPLLAFTANGVRLGMGAGYYDRYFGRLREMGDSPQLVGVAYAWQQVDSIPSDSWDVPLDAVITENGIMYFR